MDGEQMNQSSAAESPKVDTALLLDEPSEPQFGTTTSPSQPEPKLPLSTKILYALPNAALSAFGLVSQALLASFYSEVMGVSLFYVSLGSFVAGVLAAYAQIALGYFSDALKTRIGRRRPLLLAAAPVQAVALVMLMFPPTSMGHSGLATWYMILVIIVNFSTDTVKVAYNALGTELVQDDKERASLFSMSTGVGVFGLIGTAAAQAIMSKLYPNNLQAPFRILGLVIGAYTLASLLALGMCIREKPEFSRATSLPLIPGFRACMQNKPWVVLLGMLATFSLVNEITSLFNFYFEFVMKADNPSFILGIAVIVYSIFQLSGVWISQLMIRKLGKLRTLRIAFLGIIAVGAMLFGTSFVEHTPIPFFIVLLPFGVSVAAVNILGNILTSDTIDYDELHTGKRRESTYHAFTHIPNQWFAVAGRSIPLMIMFVLGYKPGADAANINNASLQWFLRCVVAGFPLIAATGAYFISWKYGIDEEAHEAILHTLRERKEKEVEVDDPLTGKPVISAPLLPETSSLLRNAEQGQSMQRPLEEQLVSPSSSDIQRTPSEQLEQLYSRRSPLMYLLYFSKRDLRMLGSSWRKRFLLKYSGSLISWTANMVICFISAVLLFKRSMKTDPPEMASSNLAFLATLATTICSLAVMYELARVKGMRWMLSLPRRTIAAYVAAFVLRFNNLKRGSAVRQSPSDDIEKAPTVPSPASRKYETLRQRLRNNKQSTWDVEDEVRDSSAIASYKDHQQTDPNDPSIDTQTSGEQRRAMLSSPSMYDHLEVVTSFLAVRVLVRNVLLHACIALLSVFFITSQLYI